MFPEAAFEDEIRKLKSKGIRTEGISTNQDLNIFKRLNSLKEEHKAKHSANNTKDEWFGDHELADIELDLKLT
jgi:hypothetical protein